MNDTNDRFQGVLLGSVVGDALGTPLDGLGKSHIYTTLKNFRTYAEPEAALKHHIDRWRKPGLYSCISQMMIILSMHVSISGRKAVSGFLESLSGQSQAEGNNNIFRHPGVTEKHLIQISKNLSGDKAFTDLSIPCARSAAIVAPSLLFSSMNGLCNIVGISVLFNRDSYSVAGTLIFSRLLQALCNNYNPECDENIAGIAIEETRAIIKEIEVSPHIIFNLSLNPDTLIESLKFFLNILSEIENINDPGPGEERIFEIGNKILKTPVTRATVNHPVCIIPYSILLSKIMMGSADNAICKIAMEGGSSPILCSLSGAIFGSLFGSKWIPDVLINDLVNRKMILHITDLIAGNKVNRKILDDFIASESMLTAKEAQELGARLKHQKRGKKEPLSRKEKEDHLSRHVVMSWTKKDKAKWRKDKREFEDHE